MQASYNGSSHPRTMDQSRSASTLNLKRQTNLGPGSYEVSYKNVSVIQRANAAIFGISKRPSIADVPRNKKFMPGPGYYRAKSEFGSARDKSPGKTEMSSLERSQSPGPYQD